MEGRESLDNLTRCLARLPGVGRRSAERMAMKLVREPVKVLRPLCEALQDVDRNVCLCPQCGSVTAPDRVPCRLCTDPGRDDAVLCVVEDPSDVAAIEAAGAFRGRYHALMGRISPMRGEGPADLRIRSLLERVRELGSEEVILALGTDVESDATAVFLSELLVDKGVRTSRLAFGLPAGSGIAYSDSVTLSRAMRGRQEV